MISAKRILKGIALFFLSIVANTSLHAQTAITTVANSSSIQNNITPKIKALSIGDKVPDIQFEHVLNYTRKKIKLSDFKGKLVILDMWGTWCTSCIDALPKMELLQKKYGDKVQILLVDSYNSEYDSDERIESIIRKLKERTGFMPSLPIPAHDTILNQLFPHLYVPYVILIDQNASLIGITYTWALTDENIQALINGKRPKLPIKNDWSFNKLMPLFVNGNGGTENGFTYRSIITGYKEGIQSFIGRTVDSSGRVTRLYVTNYPLIGLYKIAYPDVFKYPSNRMIFEVTDPKKFIISDNPDTTSENSYCYEIITPPQKSGEIMLKFMREDLYRNFHAIAKNEVRLINCYSLVINKQVSKSFTKSGPAMYDVDENSLRKFISNKPVSILIQTLNTFLDKPVIDKTDSIFNIDIELPYNFYNYNIGEIKAFLKKNGFDLIEEKQPLEVAVVTDRLND